MIRLRWLVFVALSTGVLSSIVLVLAISRGFLVTSTLEIQNESDEVVVVGVDTRIRKEIGPHSNETLYAGLLFGRWGHPDSILVLGKECSWDDVKNDEPLVINETGALCDDVAPSSPFNE